MNDRYLLHYVSKQLRTIIRQYTLEGEITEKFTYCDQMKDEFGEMEIYNLFISEKKRPVSPVLLSSGYKLTYAFIPTKSYDCIVGPVRIYQQNLNIKTAEREEDTEKTDASLPVDQSFLEDQILLIYNLYRDHPIDCEILYIGERQNVASDNKVKRYFLDLMFQNRENEKRHNPYDQEMRVVRSIEHGDIERLKRSITEDYKGEIGTLAKDPMRQVKNLALVILTLASRAAIRGGVVSETAYSLFDSYSIQIEESQKREEVIQLFRAAEFEYAYMVRELKRKKERMQYPGRNPHIIKCKAYVSAHLNEKISIGSIADALQLNASYLSGLFKKCENMSLTEYIRGEKIRQAESFLMYSEYSYSEIAAYLGFSSQSHLGRYFKKEVNMTMKQFRAAYGVKKTID